MMTGTVGATLPLTARLVYDTFGFHFTTTENTFRRGLEPKNDAPEHDVWLFCEGNRIRSN